MRPDSRASFVHLRRQSHGVLGNYSCKRVVKLPLKFDCLPHTVEIALKQMANALRIASETVQSLCIKQMNNGVEGAILVCSKTLLQGTEPRARLVKFPPS